jgi:hypothetical protein
MRLSVLEKLSIRLNGLRSALKRACASMFPPCVHEQSQRAKKSSSALFKTTQLEVGLKINVLSDPQTVGSAPANCTEKDRAAGHPLT